MTVSLAVHRFTLLLYCLCTCLSLGAARPSIPSSEGPSVPASEKTPSQGVVEESSENTLRQDVMDYLPRGKVEWNHLTGQVGSKEIFIIEMSVDHSAPAQQAETVTAARISWFLTFQTTPGGDRLLLGIPDSGIIEKDNFELSLAEWQDLKALREGRDFMAVAGARGRLADALLARQVELKHPTLDRQQIVISRARDHLSRIISDQQGKLAEKPLPTVAEALEPGRMPDLLLSEPERLQLGFPPTSASPTLEEQVGFGTEAGKGTDTIGRVEGLPLR